MRRNLPIKSASGTCVCYAVSYKQAVNTHRERVIPTHTQLSCICPAQQSYPNGTDKIIHR
jgi:hypothetical protein